MRVTGSYLNLCPFYQPWPATLAKRASVLKMAPPIQEQAHRNLVETYHLAILAQRNIALTIAALASTKT